MQGLPEQPDHVDNLKNYEMEDSSKRLWFEEYTYYTKPDGTEVRHGLCVTKQRRGDADKREYNRQYIEVKKMYYHGQHRDHWVLSFYKDGVIEERRYFVNRQLALTRDYNEKGEEVPRNVIILPEGLKKRRELIQAFKKAYGE